jgi:hypothetical protein
VKPRKISGSNALKPICFYNITISNRCVIPYTCDLDFLRNNNMKKMKQAITAALIMCNFCQPNLHCGRRRTYGHLPVKWIIYHADGGNKIYKLDANGKLLSDSSPVPPPVAATKHRTARLELPAMPPVAAAVQLAAVPLPPRLRAKYSNVAPPPPKYESVVMQLAATPPLDCEQNR